MTRTTARARNVARALYSPGDPIPERPQRAKPRRLELPVHVAIFNGLSACLPVGAVVYHIGNGEARSAAAGARLKAMGVLPGMPDLCVLYRKQAIYFEVKAPTGIGKRGKPLAPRRPSEAQRETIAAIIANGFPVAVVDNIGAAKAFLVGLGVKLREAA